MVRTDRDRSIILICGLLTPQPSLEYPFAVLVFEVDESGRGEGELYRTADLQVDGSGQVPVEDFNGEPGRLLDIEPQR